MAFNLPGMTNLNLKMSDIVGIYNGSIQHWNHSSLVDSNPGTKMPAQPIHVTARRDKSGSTELFTSSLSASDHNWKKTYLFFLSFYALATPPVYGFLLLILIIIESCRIITRPSMLSTTCAQVKLISV